LALPAATLATMGPWGQGVARAASPNLFATVSASGTELNGSGVTGVTHTVTGQYEVTFSQNVSGCAYVADTVASGSQALQAFVASGHLSANGVYVETKNQGGGLTDDEFTLGVDCGGPAEQFAVVGYTANLVRSSGGATLTSLGSGRYDVTFGTSLGKCAFLATVGDPGNGIATAPNNVSTGLATNPNTVYVETKNPGAGLSPGIPFHLAVICTGAPSTSSALVAASGLPVRGSKLTSSFNAAIGTYTVATPHASLSTACATVATRGSSTTAVPFDPGTVEVAPGPAANTVGVQTRGLLAFGGSLINLDFHAAAFC
jgi:hypothetical protein